MAEVEYRRITKSFGSTRVLDHVDLVVRDGEFMGLLGPSGCGKTTLLRILAGLETQDEGEVRIGGAEVSDLPPKRRDVAMVFQSYALYPYMTVAENIALPLTMRRTSALERLPFFVPVLGSQISISPSSSCPVTRVPSVGWKASAWMRRPKRLRSLPVSASQTMVGWVG